MGNALSRSATEAGVTGQSSIGGTETQNFCYDEQNRLVWASNNAAVPSAGNGTCGNVNYQTTMGGNYTTQYAYTNLGQLWQGPLNGGTTQEQYLYCDSAHLHELSTLSQTSSTPTCANKGTVDSTASYDTSGNGNAQVRGGITRTPTYDGLDHLIRWNSQEEWNLYDTSDMELTHYSKEKVGHMVVDTTGHTAVAAGCGGLSFAPRTQVATAGGAQAIVTLKVGEKVWSYNPTSKKMELQPILHVWINHDNDLVDLTITRTVHVQHSKATKPASEVIHTNKKHPFLTVEKGFLPVGQIKLGMHVVEASGQVGVISGWRIVPGVMTMYNLEVQHDHTYTVGVGMWVVHNCGKTDLFRAVDHNELQDVLKHGDYGLSPHGGGKYFAYTAEDATRFAGSSLNRGLKMTVTKMTVPTGWLAAGSYFVDRGGAEDAIHFSDEVLPDLYKAMTGPPEIISAPWVQSLAP